MSDRDCKHCKHLKTDGCSRWECEYEPRMDDIISRQDAINAVIAEGRSVDSRYLEAERIVHESDAVEALSMLPSADRPTGEWIYAKEQLEIVPMWECSCCRTRISKKFNYCPNCGARMKGGVE